MKATLADIRRSRFPQVIGSCADGEDVAPVLNECIQRLMDAGGETGFWGSWGRVAFTVSRATPFISLPRAFQRIINLDVCSRPINLNNEFYEFLPGGVGLKGVKSRLGLHVCRHFRHSASGIDLGPADRFDLRHSYRCRNLQL